MAGERIEVPVAVEGTLERLRRGTFAPRWWHSLFSDAVAVSSEGAGRSTSGFHGRFVAHFSGSLQRALERP